MTAPNDMTTPNTPPHGNPAQSWTLERLVKPDAMQWRPV